MGGLANNFHCGGSDPDTFGPNHDSNGRVSKDNTTRLVVYLSICKHDSLGRVSKDNTTEMVDFLLICKHDSHCRDNFISFNVKPFCAAA